MSITLFPKMNFPFTYAVLWISTLHPYVISIGEEFSMVSETLDDSSAYHYFLFILVNQAS